MTYQQKKAVGIAFFAIICLMLTPFLGTNLIEPNSLMDKANPEYLIFWRLRLPRALGAFLAGAGLSLSGLGFQALFHNPLATPFTLGISSGAALGASIYLRFGASLGLTAMAGSLVFALGGSFLSMLLVYGITHVRGGFSSSVMLLAGVIINFFFSSLVMFIQYISNAHDAVQIMRWLMGTLSGVELSRLWELAIVVWCGLGLFARIAPELDLLTAGEELAQSRGVNVYKIKMLIFISGSLITGSIVSVTGPIGFVGMMIPQICRMWLGYAHETLVPVSFFIGGAFLLLCDLLARTILAPAELPIGILTSMLGAPFFLWILFRGNHNGNMP